ncbi:MAG: hypothetical protein MNPFHGCM_00833 [Gemmatimonadaceae bacterium]|nr:hypothetical protein [Gemmatimonadaceae bacterium]
MLTQQQLVQLDRGSRDALVLSAYIARVDPDPAARTARITRLEGELSDLARGLQSATRNERLAFDAAVSNLRQALVELAGQGVPLVAFTTADGVLYAGPTLAPVASALRWGRGMLVAPYLRSLKHEHPALLVILDRTQARLFRFQRGEVTPLAEFEAAGSDHPVDHMGDAARVGFHPGTRGTVGTDEALRRERAAFDRMASRIIRRLETEHDGNPWIIFDGTQVSVREMMAALPRQLERRALAVNALSSSPSLAEIAAVASNAASSLTSARDRERVESILERAGEQGRAQAGMDSVRRALHARSAHLLLLSVTLVDGDPRLADELVHLALDAGTLVEVVTGSGAELLDTACGGVAAQLRFPVPDGAMSMDTPETGASMPV